MEKKEIIWLVISSIIPIILANFGVFIWKEDKIISITTILIAFISIYFLFYSNQIRKNKDEITKIEDWIENKEEILNTLRDIIILKKISKIK